MTVLLSAENRDLRKTINHIFDTFSSEIDCSRGIILKPNIVFPVKPRSGEITHPSMVKILIQSLRERYPGIEIIIGEGVAAGCDPQENFRISGYTKLAQELDIQLLDFNKAGRKKIPWKFGMLDVPCDILERTYINLPILKVSGACVISAALKNQKGLILPSEKKHFHRLGLHEQIAELNVAVRPSLTILDGSRFFGRNVIISGNNCGEIDATVCQLLGIDEPEHVQMSRNEQVFLPGFTVLGDRDKVRLKSTRPGAREYKRLARLRLWSNPQACTMCRYIFHDIRRNAFRQQNIFATLKLLKYSMTGAEIVWGLNPKWRKEYDTVICLGACTRKIAEEGNYIHIPGCPPTISDVNKHLP